MCFLTYCLLKLKSFLLTYRYIHFLEKISGKIYFIEHGQQQATILYNICCRRPEQQYYLIISTDKAVNVLSSLTN